MIVGAVTSGALVESTSMTFLLTLPAIAVTVCFVVVWFGVAATPPVATGRLDLKGFGLVTLSIGLVMGGLILVRLQGPGSLVPVAGARARPAQPVAVRAGRARDGGAADRRAPDGDAPRSGRCS